MKNKYFSERIKALRKENPEIRQDDVARYIGTTNQCYCLYENGKREPNLDKLSKIADFFHVSVDYLLGRKNEKW